MTSGAFPSLWLVICNMETTIVPAQILCHGSGFLEYTGNTNKKRASPTVITHMEGMKKQGLTHAFCLPAFISPQLRSSFSNRKLCGKCD